MPHIGIQDANIRWDSQVTSPFTSLTRRAYPRTVLEVFAWAEELWLHHGIYSQAIKKAVRYFLTDVEILGEDVDAKTRRKYKEVLLDTFDVMGELAVVGDDYIAFGNSFSSIYIPFRRELICPSCGHRSPLRKMRDHYTYKSLVFSGNCPNCEKSVQYVREDLKVPIEESSPKIIRWPPQYMRINSNPTSKRGLYSLDVREYTELNEGLSTGDVLWLEDTPWEIVEAANKGERFEFEEGKIFHLVNPVVSCSLPNLRGWGLPSFMSEFETALLITMLDKYNEAIIVDYLVPFRLLTPPAGTGNAENDPMLSVNMGSYLGKVRQMLAEHRRNPTGWNFLPFAMQYQVLGGEAKNLAPVELMQFFETRLLHSIGIPQEFTTPSNNAAGPLINLKMFERSWQQPVGAQNSWLNWVLASLGEIQSWERVTARLIPVSLHEDPSVQAIKFELAAANQISKDTAFRSIGLDYEYEQNKVFEEEDEFNEKMATRQAEREKKDATTQSVRVPTPAEQMLQAQQGAAGGMPPGGMPPGAAPPGGMPPGGAPMPPGGAPMPSGGGSIDEIMLQADQEAQTLISADPLTRRRRLSELKHGNEALYAQTKSRLTQLEQMAASQGVQLVRAGQIPLQ